MPWHEQQETVEQLYIHGHLDHLFDEDDASADDLDDLESAGFTVRQSTPG